MQIAIHEKWACTPCGFRFPPCRIPHSGRMAPIPQTPAKNLRFLDFPLLYRFSIKGMTLFLRFIPVLKRKWHFTKNGHALLAISAMLNPPNPCQEPEVLGFPASLSLCDKGYDVVSPVHSGFETQMAFHEKWACAPCDFRHAESRTAGAWLQSPKPLPRT